MKTLTIIALLGFVNCIVNGNLMICTDTETGQSWTILTTGN